MKNVKNPDEIIKSEYNNSCTYDLNDINIT